jgi:calcium-dependent protein kinase
MHSTEVSYTGATQMHTHTSPRRYYQWSVEVLAYILLCGYPPFSGATDHQTHELVLWGWYVFHDKDCGNIRGKGMDFMRGLLCTDQGQRKTMQRALSNPWIAGLNILIIVT